MVKFTLIAAFALGSAPLWAATTLYQAWQDAATNNPTLLAAVQNWQAAREIPIQARAGVLPQLDADLGVSRIFTLNDDSPLVGPNADADDVNHTVNIGLTQPIYNAQANANIAASRPAVRLAQAQWQQTRQQLMVAVAQQYFAVLTAYDQLRFLEADESAINRQLDQAQQRFEVGLGTSTDVLESKARVEQTRASLVDARQTIANGLDALRQLTGKRYEKLAPLKADYPIKPLRPKSDQPWLEVALAHNPALITQREQTEQLAFAIDQQQAGHLPVLNATASYQNQGNERLSSSSQATVGLGLQWNLYQGGAISSQVREAQWRYRAGEAQQKDQRWQLTLQVRQAMRGVTTAREQIIALRQALASSKSSLSATEAGYQVGTRTIVDVLNGQSAFYQIKFNLANARYQYVLNQIALAQATGRIAPRHLQAISRWLK